MDEKQVSRRRFIKHSAVLGAGALGVSGLLAACGDSPTPTAAPANPTTGSASTGTTAASSMTTAASSAKAEVVHWDFFVTQAAYFDNEIKLFQQANPNITVKKTTTELSSYTNLLPLAFKGGNAPDSYVLPYTPGFADQVAAGQVQALSDLPGWAEFAKTFPDPAVNFAEGTNTITGKTYSVPFSDTSNAMWVQLWINTKVFKDAGLVDAQGNAKLPKTGDDILAAARQIKEKSKGQVYGWGFSLTDRDQPGRQLMLAQLSGGDNSFGGQNLRTGKFSYSTSPAFKLVIDMLLKMRDEGLIIPDSSSANDEGMRALFAQHKFGMLIAGDWVINGWQTTNPEFKEYTAIPMPLFGTAEPKSYFYTAPGGTFFGLNPKSKNVNAAWLWYKWLHSKEAGERWTKSGNGRSVFPENNKPDYVSNAAIKQLMVEGPKNSRLGPVLALRNPDINKVKSLAVKPDETAVIVGLYTGQIANVAQALKELDDSKQKALEQALADAQAAGAKVSLDDYVLSDWDPTKDYLTKKK